VIADEVTARQDGKALAATPGRWRTSAVAFPGYVGRLVETFAGGCLTLGHRVPLWMPGRSGPADGRERRDNVPVPGSTLVRTGYGFSTAYRWAPMVLSRR
jgi:hypothetical protein